MPKGIYKRTKPAYNKGKHTIEWKGELPKCLDCGKELSAYKYKRCNDCKGQFSETLTKLSDSHKGQHNSIKTEFKKGERSRHWYEDRTLLKKDPRKDLDSAYKSWMLSVRKKDNWKCKLLSSECKGRLEAHHIFNWIDYPELRYIINNGITLCAFHHPRGREEEKRMIPIFQELVKL